MFLWFAGLSLLAVWQVFRSPALDHRMVMIGALLPAIDVVAGGPRILHTLVGAVAVLAVVMVLTPHRRMLRRRLLGLPVGLFMHLVLDGVWTETEVFWWPFFGGSFGDGQVPEFGRGPVGVAMEVVGAAALWFAWHRFGLEDRSRRADFVRAGRIDPGLTP